MAASSCAGSRDSGTRADRGQGLRPGLRPASKHALLDPQVARELGIVAAHHLDEALGVLAADERLDGLAERVAARRAQVEDHVDELRRSTDYRASLDRTNTKRTPKSPPRER